MVETLKYPVSTADFERIRTDGYIYVDKTEYIYSLTESGVFYFLGRPRRFGKSLLLSTIECYFSGKKDLFQGLKIESLKKGDWPELPVMRLDMSGEAFTDSSSVISMLDGHLQHWEAKLQLPKFESTPAQRFARIIREISAAHGGKKVVILIDEYDSPLSAAVGNRKLLDLYRDQLHGFYAVLKSLESHIQFCMLTGVTKFGKVSVFSGLNNLKDITFSDKYAGICGITEKELCRYLQSGIDSLAKKYGWTKDEAVSQLKFNYDGYHFSETLLDVYNPYSVLNALTDLKISPYWGASGMPTLLSKSLRDHDYDIEKLNGIKVSSAKLESLSIYHTDPVALFFQTGYLTIKAYDSSTNLFTLGYPNREVEQSILNDILGLYLPEENDVNATIILMRER